MSTVYVWQVTWKENSTLILTLNNGSGYISM